jgi:hypothetical protein
MVAAGTGTMPFGLFLFSKSKGTRIFCDFASKNTAVCKSAGACHASIQVGASILQLQTYIL